MRLFSLTLAALAATLAWTPAAHAAAVKKQGDAPGKPAELWAAVGGFCAIEDWHAAVAKCEEMEESGNTYRVLTLQDGAKIKEKLTDKTDTSYSYEIMEGPLPVQNYTATLKVLESDKAGRVTIVWTADFEPKGVEEAEAEKIIGGIFDAGVTGITKKAGQGQ